MIACHVPPAERSNIIQAHFAEASPSGPTLYGVFATLLGDVSEDEAMVGLVMHPYQIPGVDDPHETIRAIKLMVDAVTAAAREGETVQWQSNHIGWLFDMTVLALVREVAPEVQERLEGATSPKEEEQIILELGQSTVDETGGSLRDNPDSQSGRMVVFIDHVGKWTGRLYVGDDYQEAGTDAPDRFGGELIDLLTELSHSTAALLEEMP